MGTEYPQRQENRITRPEECNDIISESPLIMSSYDHFGMEVGTALGETGNNFQFLLSYNLDLYVIMKNGTGSGKTEVHVLTAASNYQAFGLEIGTALGETDDEWTFQLYGQNHLAAIRKRGGASRSMEVHILEAGTNYQTFKLETGTAMPELDDNSRVLMNLLGDIYVIKKRNTGTNKTEVHVLISYPAYDRFLMETGTAFGETDETFDFQVASTIATNLARDLYVVKKSRTGTNRTEIHVLTAASSYQQFALETGTALGETDDRFELLLRPDYAHPDFYVIMKWGTGTGRTEVHVLPA
jgi:hypothetical protein